MKIKNLHNSSRIILVATILIAAMLILLLSSCDPNTYYMMDEETPESVEETIPEDYGKVSDSSKSIVFQSSGEQIGYKYRITDLSGNGYSSARIGAWVEVSGAYDEFDAYFSQGNWKVELALKVRNNNGQYVWTDTKSITQYINLNQDSFDFSSLFAGSTTRVLINEIKAPRVAVDSADETLSYTITSIGGSYSKSDELEKIESNADTITFGGLTLDAVPTGNYMVTFTLKAADTVIASELCILNAKYGIDATCSGTIYPNKILDAKVKISDIPTGYISEFSLMSGSLTCNYPNSSKWVWYIDGSHVDNDNHIDLDINRLSAGSWGWNFLGSNYHYVDCYFLDEFGQYGSCSVEIQAYAVFGRKAIDIINSRTNITVKTETNWKTWSYTIKPSTLIGKDDGFEFDTYQSKTSKSNIAIATDTDDIKLSQGKWLIEAKAFDNKGTQIASGSTNAYINENISTGIVHLVKENATGTLKINLQGMTRKTGNRTMNLYYTIYKMGETTPTVPQKKISGKKTDFKKDTTLYQFSEISETLVNGIYEVIIQNKIDGQADGWVRAIVEINNNGTTTIHGILSADRDI